MFAVRNTLSSFAMFLSRDLNLVTKNTTMGVFWNSLFAFYATQVTNFVLIVATDLTIEYSLYLGNVEVSIMMEFSLFLLLVRLLFVRPHFVHRTTPVSIMKTTVARYYQKCAWVCILSVCYLCTIVVQIGMKFQENFPRGQSGCSVSTDKQTNMRPVIAFR